MTYIFVVGDSITYGAWDFSKGGWVQRLRGFLDKKVKENPQNFFMTYNLGIDGHTTRDWLSIFSAELEARMRMVRLYKEQLIVIIALGGNDASRILPKNGCRVGEIEFRKNIVALITQARKFTERVVLVGISPGRMGKIPELDNGHVVFDDADILEYNAILQSIATEQKILFIDVFGALRKVKKGVSFDGVHLSDKGHKKMFELVRDVLVEKGWI